MNLTEEHNKLRNDKNHLDCAHKNRLIKTCIESTNNKDSNGEGSKMSRVMRKPTFCICENKDADQLHGNREADQRLCFRYIDSTIPLLSKSESSSL